MGQKQTLVNELNKKIDLFQSTIGKSQANVTATTTMILDAMANTILAQFEQIEKLNMEIANLKAVKEVPETSSGTIPDPVLT